MREEREWASEKGKREKDKGKKKKKEKKGTYV